MWYLKLVHFAVMDLQTLENVCHKISCPNLQFYGILPYPKLPFVLRNKPGFAFMYKVSKNYSHIAHLILVLSNGINSFYYIDTFGKIPSRNFCSLLQTQFPAYQLHYSKTKLQKYNTCYCSIILLYIIIGITVDFLIAELVRH